MRRADYGESNRMLTLLTDNLGTVSACAYGVKSKKSKLRAATQPFCCAEFVLLKKGGDIYRVESADIAESFYPICEDIVKLSLANYFCETAAEAYADRDKRILSLLLNTLYVLAYKNKNPKLVKAVFELKLTELSGYNPNTEECIHCGRKDNLTGFDFSGGVVCENCKNAAALNITDEVLAACRYILSADDKRIYSFYVSDAAENRLADLAEGYFLHQSERRYRSLEYYKKMI